MKAYSYPNKEEWNALVQRPILDQKSLDAIVLDVLKETTQKTYSKISIKILTSILNLVMSLALSKIALL